MEYHRADTLQQARTASTASTTVAFSAASLGLVIRCAVARSARGPRSSYDLLQSFLVAHFAIRGPVRRSDGRRRLWSEKLRPDPGDAAAADGHRVGIAAFELDQAVVAGTLETNDRCDVYDVAAMDAREARRIQPGLDVTDGQRTEILCRPVEDVGVVGVGVDRDNAVDGDEMAAPVMLDGKVADRFG